MSTCFGMLMIHTYQTFWSQSSKLTQLAATTWLRSLQCNPLEQLWLSKSCLTKGQVSHKEKSCSEISNEMFCCLISIVKPVKYSAMTSQTFFCWQFLEVNSTLLYPTVTPVSTIIFLQQLSCKISDYLHTKTSKYRAQVLNCRNTLFKNGSIERSVLAF